MIYDSDNIPDDMIEEVCHQAVRSVTYANVI